MNLDGSNPVRISHDWANDDCLVWSPDGRYILFRTKQQSSWDFWVAEMDGLLPTGGTYLVKADVGEETYPWSWSNDGWLLYLERATDTTIYKLPVDTEGPQPAGECARFSDEFKQTVGSGVPSRRGDRVCVNVSGEEGRKFYIVSPVESRPLLVPAEIRARSVIGWGPDDSWILLTERKAGEDSIFEDSIIRMYIEDNVAERIAVAPGPQLISNFPALSPDGNWLAMEQGPWGCERELVLVNLTDGGRRPIHVGGCRLMSAWSSDGAELAVARNLEEGKKSDIVIVSAEGGPLRQVAAWDTDAGNVGPLAWSPDGRHLAYVLHSPEKGKPNKLMSVPVSGGPPACLFEPQSGKPMPNPWRPYWSPDGSQIIFTGISWEHETWMMRDFLRAR